MGNNFNTVDDYIASFPSNIQAILQEIREVIKLEAKDANELISYGMAGYKLNDKPLIYFAAFKNHIGIYATPTAHKAFQEELSKYKQGKGSVQFPFNQAMPLKLIRKMIHFKKQELNSKLK